MTAGGVSAGGKAGRGVLGRDVDTLARGTSPPFDDWEHDHTGLVHVLWQARREGLSLDGDEDEIASLILNSRWAAAYRAAAVVAAQADETPEAGGADE